MAILSKSVSMVVTSNTDMIDLETLHSKIVTLDELFAEDPIEGEPYVEPSVANFDEDAYWTAFYLYTVEKFSAILWEAHR